MPDTPELRLARSADYPADRLTALDTTIATGPELFVDQVDLIERSFGPTVPQGGLFAYLFRRFGYPNTGSDPYKELCSYILTTAHPGMLMSITPYAGGDSSISIRFMVPFEVNRAVRDWELRHRRAQERAFLDWIEESDQVPEWADSTLAEIAGAGWPLPDEAEGWRRIVPALHWISWSAKHEERSDPRVEWLGEMQARFADLRPEMTTDRAYRDPDPETWGTDDPLTEYAEAIAETLTELKRPVWVRDVPIDPWGLVKEEDLPLVPDEEDEDYLVPDRSGDELVAPVAGYPAGDLGNQDPEGFAELHGAIVRAGGGDAAAGIARTLALLAGVEAAESNMKDEEQ